METKQKLRDSQIQVEISLMSDTNIKKTVALSNIKTKAGQDALRAHGYIVTDTRYAEQLNPTNPVQASGDRQLEINRKIDAILEDNMKKDAQIDILMQKLQEKEIKVAKEPEALEEEIEAAEPKEEKKSAGRPSKTKTK